MTESTVPAALPSTAVAQITRATPRQATSALTTVVDGVEDDDPLLAFAPYLHPAPRGNSITPERQRRFVATLAATGIVSQAARSIGKSIEALYKLRARPGAEGFAAAWDAALERGVQRLEDCALERALKGTAVPIVSGGAVVGHWDKPDNGLLRFLLQHRLADRYGARGGDVRLAAEAAAAEATHAAEMRDLRRQLSEMYARAKAAEGRATWYEEQYIELCEAQEAAAAEEDDDDYDADNDGSATTVA